MGELHCHWFGRQTVAALYRTTATPATPAPAAPTIAAPAATGPADAQLTDMMGKLAARRAAAAAPADAPAAAPAAARNVAVESASRAEGAPPLPPGTEPTPLQSDAALQCVAVESQSPPPRTPSAVRLQSARAANGSWRHVLQAARTLLQSEQIVLSQHAPPCLWLGPTLGVGANCEVKSATAPTLTLASPSP